MSPEERAAAAKLLREKMRIERRADLARGVGVPFGYSDSYSDLFTNLETSS